MHRTLMTGLILALTSANSALACSCLCEFEHTVSEYLENHVVFWGTPTESHLKDDYVVEYKVEIKEGYDRLPSGESLTILSTPDDGASCGTNLSTGVMQFIVAYKGANAYGAGSCTCAPPSAYLIKYLKGGKDTYLPNISDCWDDDSNDFKSNRKCSVWRNAPEDWDAEDDELRQIRTTLSDKSNLPNE